MVTSEGFVVLKGAVVNEKASAKSLSAGMKKLQDKIFADGRVVNMTTTEANTRHSLQYTGVVY